MGKTSKTFLAALAFLPLLIWLLVIWYYSVNLPWFDDFDPFPDFLHKWITQPAFSDRAALLFQPNNEHRMVVGKLVTLLYYWITGQLNFTFLHFAGAGFTIGTLAIFWQLFKKANINPWYFLPVPFLLFQLQSHLVFLWAICSLQHQPVIFFMCLSMLFLARERIGWGIVAAACATYVMSNGIFIWPAGAVILILRSRYKELFLWLFAAVLAIGFYFRGLSTQGNESSVQFFLENPHLSVLGFFASLGGLFDFFPDKAIEVRSALPVIMGFLVMIWVFIWLMRQVVPWMRGAVNWPARPPGWMIFKAPADRNREQFQVFLLGILSFLLVNALVICLLRPRFGFFVMIVSNYKMYPALFLIVAYLTFISSGFKYHLQKLGFRVAVAVSLLIWVLSALYYLPVIADRSRNLTMNGYNQEFNGYGLGHVPFSKAAAYVDHLMKEMVRRQVYQYPEAGKKLAAHALGLADTGSKGSVLVRREEAGVYVNDTISTMSLSRETGNYAFLRSGRRVYLFRMEPRKYEGRNVFRQYDSGSDVLIPYTSALPGTYELGVLKMQQGVASGAILEKITIP